MKVLLESVLSASAATKAWLPVVLVIAVGACGNGVGPTVVPEGTLRFAYQGEIEGSFDVTGAYPPPGQDCTACAFARPTVQGDRLAIAGSRSRDDLRDNLTFTIPYPTQPGQYVLEAPSNFAYGIPAHGTPKYAFRMVSGEVIITELEDGRIRGEFSGEGEDIAYLPEDTVWRVEIVRGTFDLPVLAR